MKRSRFFLGTTTALLAVAGVAAAKTHRVPKNSIYLQVTNGLGGARQCALTNIVTKCTSNTSDHSFLCLTLSDIGRPMYTAPTANAKYCLTATWYNQN